MRGDDDGDSYFTRRLVQRLSDPILWRVPRVASVVARYEYHVPLDHPTGTFWYHPHHIPGDLLQQLGGMSGLIIVEEPAAAAPAAPAAAAAPAVSRLRGGAAAAKIAAAADAADGAAVV